MKSTTTLLRMSVMTLLLAAAFTAGPAAAAVAPAPGKTLANLQEAFNGESNAHAKYLAFARKAQEEGYGQVASLFRAAARAEEIHSRNHAKVIESLGAVPVAKVAGPVVKSTRENLEAAIQGETYERDTMYPDFLATARSEGNRDALRTFNLAKTAEAEHAKLYAEALKNLAQLKGSRAVTYYVCTVCGYTTMKLDFAKCPSCFTSKDDYVKVS